MNAEDLLLWARGPGMTIGLWVFVAGIVLRFFEIFMLGRKENLAELRGNGIKAGITTMFTRSWPADFNTFKRSAFVIIAGYTFHIGLVIVFFFFDPHLEIIKAAIGFSWSGLPSPVVDLFTVLTMVALLALFWRRLTHPVVKHLTTGEDYLVWVITFLPVVTGYLSYHHLFANYTLLLAMHVLSVVLLLVLFPFTKLTHAFTLFIARWYSGMISGERGVQI